MPPPTLPFDLPDEPRLRRVPVADHRDPRAAPPPPLLWDQRMTTRVGRDRYLVIVPCPGAPTGHGVEATLTDQLRRRWVTSAEDAPWHITSVAAAFEHQPGCTSHIKVVMTATIQALGAPPLDDATMGRDLRELLAA